VPRYYFKVADHTSEFVDEAGEDLDSLDKAMALATRIARELAADASHYRNYIVIICDEQENELARVPVEPE
jgi:hypothetical protein